VISRTEPQTYHKRILVVDDDPSILAMVSKKLSLEGYDVIEARSGDEALAAIEAHGLPHLAVVDLMMPGMDGVVD